MARDTITMNLFNKDVPATANNAAFLHAFCTSCLDGSEERSYRDIYTREENSKYFEEKNCSQILGTKG